MMNKITMYMAVVATLVLTSCYRDLDLQDVRDYKAEQQVVALHAIVNPDSVVSAVVTRPYFYTDDHQRPDYVPGMSIELTVNGEARGLLQYDDRSHKYYSTVKPGPGDVVELKTEYLFQPVTGQDILPRPVSIERVTATRQGPLAIYTGDDYVYTYKITFKDAPGVDNFYFLQYDAVHPRVDFMGERDFTHEYVFQQLASRINRTVPGWTPYSYLGLPFSDDGIDGKTHTLEVRETVQGAAYPGAPRSSEMNRVFRLYAISRAYYEYLLTVITNDTNGSSLRSGMVDAGLVNPIKTYSNVEGGLGFVGSYVLATDTLHLK